MAEAGSHRQGCSQNFKWLVESHQENAFPVPGRRLLGSLGTCGWEQNAVCSRACSQHPRTTQRRKAHQLPGSHTASGLSLREPGGAVEAKGKVLCRCLEDGPGWPSAPWAGLWDSFLPPVWQLNPLQGWSRHLSSTCNSGLSLGRARLFSTPPTGWKEMSTGLSVRTPRI